jgi:glycerophosphoryl diester phosphodiesterase
MKLDVVRYQAIHRSRLAGARAVHLHPTQLTEAVVAAVRGQGVEIHAWDVNDEPSLELVARLGIPRLCTDRFAQAYAYREKISG